MYLIFSQCNFYGGKFNKIIDGLTWTPLLSLFLVPHHDRCSTLRKVYNKSTARLLTLTLIMSKLFSINFHPFMDGRHVGVGSC